MVFFLTKWKFFLISRNSHYVKTQIPRTQIAPCFYRPLNFQLSWIKTDTWYSPNKTSQDGMWEYIIKNGPEEIEQSDYNISAEENPGAHQMKQSLFGCYLEIIQMFEPDSPGIYEVKGILFQTLCTNSDQCIFDTLRENRVFIFKIRLLPSA